MAPTLDGRVALVTGAGGGLGRAYALDFARRGALVVVNDVGSGVDGLGNGASAAHTVVEEIRATGGTAVASYDSVSTPEGGEAAVATALDTFGHLDAVVNNAGILRDRTMGKLAWEDVTAVLDVHVRGAFHITQPAFRAMREAGYGRLVFTSSNAGTFGNFGQSVYGAAKAALIGLSGAVALEGARHGITSNVICPIARTRMTEPMLGEFASALDPEHVAPLVAYLSSQECRVTHRVYSAGGGHYARVFTGLTAGWEASGEGVADIGDIAAHLDRIDNTEQFTLPDSASDEVRALAAILQRAGTSVG